MRGGREREREGEWGGGGGEGKGDQGKGEGGGGQEGSVENFDERDQEEEITDVGLICRGEGERKGEGADAVDFVTTRNVVVAWCCVAAEYVAMVL